MILGAVFVYGFHPLLGRWQKWSDLMRMQDRLLGELSIDSAQQIVLINWPSDDVRTAGVLTATFPATDSKPENGQRLLSFGAANKFWKNILRQSGRSAIHAMDVEPISGVQLDRRCHLPRPIEMAARVLPCPYPGTFPDSRLVGNW